VFEAFLCWLLAATLFCGLILAIIRGRKEG
jgi:hypothetical protein